MAFACAFKIFVWMYDISNDLVESDGEFCKPDFRNLTNEVVFFSNQI